MSESTTGVPSGMYPDPENPAQLRYWDGKAWGAKVNGGPVNEDSQIENGHRFDAATNSWVPLPPQQIVQPVYVQAPVYTPKPVVPGKGMSVAGMTLGIVAWSVALLSFFLLSPVSFILGVIGLPLSAVGFYQAKKAGAPVGKGIAGIALNATGLAIPILSGILLAIITAIGIGSGA
jgi:hypothetical protein